VISFHDVRKYFPEVHVAADWWISPGTPVSSTNKTDRHHITEILLKVALNTINQTRSSDYGGIFGYFTQSVMEV
jgi:hypothetical protein